MPSRSARTSSGATVSLPSHWPPQRELQPLDKQLKKPPEKSITTTEELPTPQVQRSSRGLVRRLHNDGSYPQHNGEGPVEEPYPPTNACPPLDRRFGAMLSRILNDQLERSGRSAALQAIAAICDLLGYVQQACNPTVLIYLRDCHSQHSR